MATIKEIAAAANVSVATVSYALNGKKGIGEKKKAEILKLAKIMGYVPNSVARSLQARATNMIGVIMPRLTNSFNGELLVKLEEYTREKGYYLLLGTTDNNPEIEAEVIEKLVRKNIDALVVVPGNYSNEEFYREVTATLNKNKIPVVFIIAFYKNILANYVALDLETAFYNLTNYLFSKTEKGNILFFGGHPDEYYTRVRLTGIKKAFGENGMRFPEKNQIDIGKGNTMKNGYRAIMNFLKKNTKIPEAIIGLNDLVAFGIIKGLKENGIIVPDDVLVTGCDDIYLPAMEDYNLTTLRIPVEEVAKFTINAVMNNLANTKLSLQQQIILQLDIIKRDTA